MRDPYLIEPAKSKESRREKREKYLAIEILNSPTNRQKIPYFSLITKFDVETELETEFEIKIEIESCPRFW